MAMRYRHRTLVLALVLLAPAVALPSTTRWLAEHAAPALAAQLVRFAEAVASLLPAPASPPPPLPPSPGARSIAALGDPPSPAALQQPGDRPSVRPRPTPRGVLVRKERVLAAARGGIRPSGHAVPATWERPAGVALTGVGALGVGLRDGDVLTHVNGQPVSSPNLVVALAAGALRSGAGGISGEVWRGRQRLMLTVELPRVRFNADAPPPAASGP